MAEIYGKIIAVLPQKSGTSASGKDWCIQSYVIETQEHYPKKLCFDVFGADKIAQFNIQQGEMLNVQFDIDARERDDRWWNSIKAWNVQRTQQGAPQQAPGTYYQQPPQQPMQQPQPQAPFPPQQAPVQQVSAVPNAQPAPTAPPSGNADNLPF